jgi:threonine/homoserine/homoserine lactone efflux protein
MTILQALLLFTLAAGLLTITPGLDTLLVLRTCVASGARAALLAGAGVCCGCLVWGVLVAAGVGALLAVSTLAYEVLRIAGAAYLLWLGLRLLWRPRSALPANASPAGGAAQSFMRGVLTNLLNPKVGVFYISFLPQFIPAGISPVAFGSLLALIHALEGLLWFALLTLATRPLSQWLAQARLVKALDRGTGAVFVLFGLRLAGGSARPA